MTDTPVVVSTTEDALAVLRRKSMRQGLYDAGATVMADCLLDLHGALRRLYALNGDVPEHEVG